MSTLNAFQFVNGWP